MSTVKLSDTIHAVALNGLSSLRELCAQSRAIESEKERKTHLLRGIEQLRHHLLRLVVTVRWAKDSDDLVSRAQVTHCFLLDPRCFFI